MKLKITILSAMAFGLALTLSTPVLRAEEGGATPALAGKKHAKGEKAKGAIEKVDAAAKSITIAGKTYKIDDTAKVSIDGAEKALADLKIGDAVSVRYTIEADGSLVAHGIKKGEGKGGKRTK